MRLAPLGRNRCAWAVGRRVAGAAVDRRGCRPAVPRQHQCRRASRRNTGKKGSLRASKLRGGWNTRIHIVAASDQNALDLHLSGGYACGASENMACQIVRDFGIMSVAPPKANQKITWDSNSSTCMWQNGIERLFLRTKGCRRGATRLGKLNIVCFASTNEMIRR